MKLDADLVLPAMYFREVAQAFQSDPRIGICGGFVVLEKNGSYQWENKIDYHVRGAFKAIRRTCYEEIGGFKPVWNWDGIDEIEAMSCGWKTKALEIPVIQLRPTSTAYSPLQMQFRNGYEAYRVRNSVILVLIRATFRMMKPPLFLCSLAYLIGFVMSFFKRERRLVSKELSRRINQFHLSRCVSEEWRGRTPRTREMMAKIFSHA